MTLLSEIMLDAFLVMDWMVVGMLWWANVVLARRWGQQGEISNWLWTATIMLTAACIWFTVKTIA